MKTYIVSLLSSAFMLGCTAAIAAPANDDFENSERVAGTNITYYGTFTSGTLQPGEPVPGDTNTIWMSWVAPARGAVWLSKASAPQWQYYAVYTGSRVDQLQPVPLVGQINNINRFLADEGTVYYFQFSGGSDTIVFYLQFDPLTSCPNDNWNNAQVVRGTSLYDAARSVGPATMELNEPAHMGNVAQKSIWWKWQAPFWGAYAVSPSGSLVTNFVLAAYTGTAVEALTPVAKSTNQTLQFYMEGGATYYIAGAVPTNAFGDLLCYFHPSAPPETSVHTVPGNLLLEPSWENTALEPQYWGMSSPVGGHVNDKGGVDGTTWPSLGEGQGIWQDVPTIPGHKYAIKFAYRFGGDAQLAVSLGGALVGTSTMPAAEGGYWHWDTYIGTASNTTSRVVFQNLAGMIDLDAFSVVDASAPPAIVTQPASASSIEGGSVSFVVGLYGASPLRYQWFFNDLAIADQTNKVLMLNPVSKSQEGDYQVVITNSFGAVTSAVASLRVDAPTTATILCEPHGDVVPVGGYYNFSVTAAGPPPLSYQWFMNGQPVTGATYSTLRFTEVQGTNAGVYQVRVQNDSSTAWSLPATLVVDSSAVGGGTFDLRNKTLTGPTVNAPVADVDGSTLLNTTNYVAQLYAGPSLETLRPAGVPTPFHYLVYGAGYWTPKTVKLANVAPGSNAVVQVCVWDANYGSSYEQARATGGRFGKSNILILPSGGIGMPPTLPQTLLGLQSFRLQAGLPFFQVGTVSFVERQPGGTIVWALHGQAGSIYLIEKSKRTHETVWHPFAVVTNVTGTVTFTDSADSGAANVWFRARILN